MGSAITTARRSRRALWSRRSTKWSANDSARNNRCNGPKKVPMCCYRRECGRSTGNWALSSSAGIRTWTLRSRRSRYRHNPRHLPPLQVDHLTGPEVRLRMCGDGAHLLIDLVEQCRDKIEGDHGLLRSWQGVTLSSSLEEGHDYDNKTSKYYKVSLVCQRLTPLVIRATQS